VRHDHVAAAAYRHAAQRMLIPRWYGSITTRTSPAARICRGDSSATAVSAIIASPHKSPRVRARPAPIRFRCVSRQFRPSYARASQAAELRTSACYGNGIDVSLRRPELNATPALAIARWLTSEQSGDSLLLAMGTR